jgi:hypothetical protein
VRGELLGLHRRHQLATRRADRLDGATLRLRRGVWGKGRRLRLNDPIRLRLMRSCGAWLALLALTLQLAMSFGHFHAGEFAAGGIGTATSDATKGWHGLPVPDAATLKRTKIADDEDRCPICFSAFLLGTSFVPHSKQPSLMAQFVDIQRVVARDFDRVVKTGRAPFQSRAPPLA